MRIFELTTGADTGGISFGIKRAFDSHGGKNVLRSMVTSTNYIAYPRDLDWSQVTLEQQYDAADVVHLHNTLHAHRWYDAYQGKPTVLMHHSRHGLAENAEEAKSIRAVQVGSTLDLSILNPDVTWTPPPCDVEGLRALRAKLYRPSDRIRVAHAPTNRDVKGTDAFLAVTRDLIEAGIPIDVDLIEGVTWGECLRRKARADVVYDQMELGYGLNAVEAWGMGTPVIAGIADPALRKAMGEGWGGALPFAEAAPATLRKVLRDLVRSPRIRERYATRGAAHVGFWHDEARVVRQLTAIYAAAPRTLSGGRSRRVLPVRAVA